MRSSSNLPFLVVVLGLSGLSMLFPAGIASNLDRHLEARIFFYHAIIVLLITVFAAIATWRRESGKNLAEKRLAGLLAVFALLPVVLATPLYNILPEYGFFNLYFEMVSCLTTTGATIFENSGDVSLAIHFWRGQVAWSGGFLVWLSAIAIMEPLNLGGFEVVANSGRQAGSGVSKMSDALLAKRLAIYAKSLLPIYAGATAILWLILVFTGESWVGGLIHAMATISTSGILSGEFGAGANNSFRIEAVVFLFLFLAATRLVYEADQDSSPIMRPLRDPELRFALFCALALPLALVLPHLISEPSMEQRVANAMRAYWGAAFTMLSYLTTTGFESAWWGNAKQFSGMQAPELLLIGLACAGGGVATTAGGIKLLRIYALYEHSLRETTKLTYPSSISGAGGASRRMHREGAYIAWIFFMLFVLSLAGTMMVLSALGMDFESSLVLAVSSLATVGPLAETAFGDSFSFGQLDAWTKMVLAATMVVGRLELLAVIALLNPDLWRA